MHARHLQFVFWWDDAYFGALRPRCSCSCSSGTGSGHGRLLAGLLTDDGGIARESALARLDAGIGMARAVGLGRLGGCRWDRETLGAHIGKEGVEIGWLRHDGEIEIVPLDRFEHVLAAWRGFLSKGPAGSGRDCVSVSA